jgi:hypothetical protein
MIILSCMAGGCRLLPWLGSGLYLVDGSAERRDLGSQLVQWTRDHGPLFRTTQFGQNILYLAHPDDIRKWREAFYIFSNGISFGFRTRLQLVHKTDG